MIVDVCEELSFADGSVGWAFAQNTTVGAYAAYLAPASCQIVTFPEGISERRAKFSEHFLARASAAIEELESRTRPATTDPIPDDE